MEVFEVYKTKRDKAMHMLAKLGAVKFIDNLEMFHGRAGDGSMWEVKSQFNNAGNSSGHHNLFNVSGLYAGTLPVAQRFASARSAAVGTPEIHKIVGKEEGLVLINMHFSYSKLNPTQKEEYKQALRILNDFTIPRGVVVPFEKRDVFPLVKYAIEDSAKTLKAVSLSSNDVQDITGHLAANDLVKKSFFNRQELYTFIKDFVGARNAKTWLRTDLPGVISTYMSNTQPVLDGVEYPLGDKYVSAWCANNGIIGCILDINSATLQCKVKDVVHIFDTTKIATERQQGEIYQDLLLKYGKLSQSLSKVSSNDEINQFLRDANPSEIMKFIMQDSKSQTLYQMNSGVWENWTVGQHTRAVLQFFEDNYKNDVPKDLIPIIKTVLLVHDAGKGIAKRDNLSQEQANKLAVPVVLQALNTKESVQKIINFLVNQPFTSQVVLGKNKKTHLKALCENIRDLYEDIFKEKATKEVIVGLVEIAIILQTCDSGAYTRYAKIVESSGAIVGGGSDRFTASFTQKNGKPRLKVFEQGL